MYTYTSLRIRFAILLPVVIDGDGYPIREWKYGYDPSSREDTRVPGPPSASVVSSCKPSYRPPQPLDGRSYRRPSHESMSHCQAKRDGPMRRVTQKLGSRNGEVSICCQYDEPARPDDLQIKAQRPSK